MTNKNQIYNIKINHESVLKNMIDKVNNRIPSSFIRKGDGENIIIGYNHIKGIRLRKYLKKIRHFNISYFNISFQKFFRNELIKSFYEADYIGVHTQYYYYGYTSSARRFEREVTEHFQFNKNKYIDNHFQFEFIKKENSNLLHNPLAQDLISNKKIGLITHFNLSDFLSNFNSEVIFQTSIPKRDLRNINIKMNKEKYDDIVNLIKQNSSKVDIWFLAAGAYAKPFGNYIKQCGGIAVDLGSSIDTWANEYHSRKFLRTEDWKTQ
jgi:hypothetical protein